MTARPLNWHRAMIAVALVLAGCSFGPAGDAGQTVTAMVGDLLVTRDAATPGATAPIDQARAEAAALAWVASNDETVDKLVARQSSRIVGLLEVKDQRTTLAYHSGSPEDDWVILLRGASPTWAHVDAMVAVDAATGEVRSGQLVQSN